ncbi:sigma-70 family RNA polymerase sigma factor [Longispora albida]|uniref:sigma-70 family RNA polymerase sigma factor n=1 Tax=Longispora albida TaxID=203523 RepID=UPI00037503E1|nr:sigma-70 family RNA polymerase sigma factor [Longispora albida]
MQTDASLATAATFGDRGAFGEIYDRYSPGLLGFVTRLTGDRHLAEDIVQDCFLTAWKDLAELRDPASVRSWLFGIAYRKAMDTYRRPGAVLLADLPEVADETPGANPGASAEQREAASLVWTAAHGLEPRQRAVLEMSVRWELNSAEIAEVLGVGRAHASVLVHRSRSALGNAVRVLLVARQRGKCAGLDELVGPVKPALTARQRSSVDHHIRRCPSCRRLGASVSLMSVLGALYAAADKSLPPLQPTGVVLPDTPALRHAKPAAKKGLVAAAAALTVLLAAGGAGWYLLKPAPQPAEPGLAAPPPAAAVNPAPAPVPESASQPPAPPSAQPTPDTAISNAPPKPTPTPSKTTTSAAPVPTAGTPEMQVLAITNQRRAEAGCGPLHWDDKLAKAAAGHSTDMANRGYFDHNTPEGVTPWDRAKAAGYMEPAAENIAAGNASAEATMKQWMNSPGHKANILNCSFKALGVGRATGGPYRYYWTQVFGYK